VKEQRRKNTGVANSTSATPEIAPVEHGEGEWATGCTLNAAPGSWFLRSAAIETNSLIFPAKIANQPRYGLRAVRETASAAHNKEEKSLNIRCLGQSAAAPAGTDGRLQRYRRLKKYAYRL
jgi:hypothetical protein